MNEQLREINNSLHALDDAHRLGHITRDEYRERRRHLLGVLCDGGGITSRNVAAETVPYFIPPPSATPPRRRHDDAVASLFPWWKRWLDWRRWFRRRH